MLDEITSLLNNQVPPFASHYQAYVCKVQDALMDKEIQSVHSAIQHQPELYQLKQLQSLLSNV